MKRLKEFFKRLCFWKKPEPRQNATLKRLLQSTEIDPNRRKRNYSEKETTAYIIRRLESLERQIKRINSLVDSVKQRFENHLLAASEKTKENGDEQDSGSENKD